MKDLHCHLLYGIDDGCDSLEESIDLLKKMSRAGVTEVILTPHYIENSKYACNNKHKSNIFMQLKERLKKEKINIKMYLGNEIYFTTNIIELMETEEVYTLNRGKYFLFEIPLHEKSYNLGEVISKITSKGYVPILAHPERYALFQKHPETMEEYLRMGILMQGNIPSLFGKYGFKAKKLLIYSIKKGWISFLGSDAHHEFFYNRKKVERKLKRINKNQEYIHDMLEGNFDRVVKNEEIGMIR